MSMIIFHFKLYNNQTLFLKQLHNLNGVPGPFFIAQYLLDIVHGHVLTFQDIHSSE